MIVVASVAFVAGFSLEKNEQIINGIIILFIVLVNAFAGAYQEYHSERSAQLLKQMMKNEALVRRNAREQKVDSEELVPGDIISLKEGDKVPADARILKCSELKIDESLLTGESVHVEKNTAQIKKEVSLAERKNMVYMNTFVARGIATCVVTGTGKNTEVGAIAQAIGKDQKSLFLKEVDDASKKITYVAIALIIIALTFFSVHEKSWISIFMLGAALIVGSIPEGLPCNSNVCFGNWLFNTC